MRCTVAAIDMVTDNSRPARALASTRAAMSAGPPSASSFFRPADNALPVFACAFSRAVSVSISSSIALSRLSQRATSAALTQPPRALRIARHVGFTPNRAAISTCDPSPSS